MHLSVKRAATSETRSEPFVITIKLIITKIKNTTNPTIIFPPTTKDPNVSTTPPASPCVKWHVLWKHLNLNEIKLKVIIEKEKLKIAVVLSYS